MNHPSGDLGRTRYLGAVESAIRTVEVKNLGDFIERATPRVPDPQSGRLREAAVYRGCTDADEPLLTSLDRLGMPEMPPHAKGDLEEHLLRNFIRYSRPHVALPANGWEFLVVAQHHGLPTRLLDWTSSPLVAAHFATVNDGPERDCVVWKLDWGAVHRHFNLPALALMVEDLDRVLRERGIQSPWDLFAAPEDARELFVCMVEPPALDARIVAQSAAFTLCSDKTRSLDAILIACGLGATMTRFIIPAARAGLIRDQLDLCSVDERRLFPDLDGVAAEMRRYYSTSAQYATGLERERERV